MNVCSPSVPAKLPFQRSEQVNASIDKILVWLQILKNQKPNIPLFIEMIQCPLVPANRRGFAPRLLCMGLQGCTFAITLCCWKNMKTRVCWYGMIFQCFVTIFVWFLSSWLSKAYFKYSGNTVSYVDVTNRKVVCSTICRGHVKAFRHSFLLIIAHSPPLCIRLMGLVVWKDKHIQAQTEMVNQYIMLREQTIFLNGLFQQGLRKRNYSYPINVSSPVHLLWPSQGLVMFLCTC